MDEVYNQLARGEVNNFTHTDTVHTVISEQDEMPINSTCSQLDIRSREHLEKDSAVCCSPVLLDVHK